MGLREARSGSRFRARSCAVTGQRRFWRDGAARRAARAARRRADPDRRSSAGHHGGPFASPSPSARVRAGEARAAFVRAGERGPACPRDAASRAGRAARRGHERACFAGGPGARVPVRRARGRRCGARGGAPRRAGGAPRQGRVEGARVGALARAAAARDAARDQTQALSPTEYDPGRVTASGGASFWLEARATWRLDRLVFADDEVALERVRDERAAARQKLVDRVLDLLFAWQRALAVRDDPAGDPGGEGRRDQGDRGRGRARRRDRGMVLAMEGTAKGAEP